jgi:hypothetical protein
VYGQEVVLPIEVNLGAYRLVKQNNILMLNSALMMDNIDEVTDKRLEPLEEIEKDKWKTILLIGTKSNKFGKWSPWSV